MDDDGARQPGETLLPLSAESVEITRRQAETARVRVRVRTRTRPAEVDETLTHEDVTVTRVPIGRPVDAAPPVREENGLTIIPVMEEVLVVERRLILKEEIRIQRTSSTRKHHEIVKLREQFAMVERNQLQEEPCEIPGVCGFQSKEDLP